MFCCLGISIYVYVYPNIYGMYEYTEFTNNF
jgi:hypothetical protein